MAHHAALAPNSPDGSLPPAKSLFRTLWTSWNTSRRRRRALKSTAPAPGFRLGGRNDDFPLLVRQTLPIVMPAKAGIQALVGRSSHQP